MAFPFNYSQLNKTMVNSSLTDSISILGAQLNQKMATDSLLYYTPIFNFSNNFNPFPSSGLNSTNPFNVGGAIANALQDLQNHGWQGLMNPSFNFGNLCNNNWTPSLNLGGNNNSGSVENKEYTALKALINKYKEIGEANSSLSPTMLTKINEALNKSGTDEEKLTALKDLYKNLNKNKLEQAMLQMTEYKEMLTTAGYDFGTTNKEADKQLKADIRRLDNSIKTQSPSQWDLSLISKDSDPFILRTISYWNDTHKDANNRGILRLIAKHVPANKNEHTMPQTAVKNLAMSLINKADDFKGSIDGNFSKLDKAQKEVSEALTKVQNDFTEPNLNKLADKFDKLYAMLRILEAEKIKNNMKTKYSFLNDISSNDTDFVNDNLVVKSTKDDLAKEGITLSNSEIDEIKEEAVDATSDIDDKYDAAEDKIDALTSNETKALVKTEKDGVFKSTADTTNEPAHLYMVIDDKIVELKGVKSIDKNGTCTTIDNKKISLENAKKNTVEVSAQDIIDYNKIVQNVNEYLKKGTLIQCAGTGMPAGMKLYKSKGKPENSAYPQYFVVKDGKLKQINCKYVHKNGFFVMNDSRKNVKFADLTDNDFIEVSSESDIKTDDEYANAKQKKIGDKKAEQDAKIEEAKAKNDTNYKAHEVEAAEEYGTIIKDKLANWWTTDSDWEVAKSHLDKINEDNVYSVISGYCKEDKLCSDNIIQQIATENGRVFGDKKAYVIKIRDAVLKYAEKYGASNSGALATLKQFKITEIFNNNGNVIVNSKAKELDNLILKVLGLEKYI